MKIFFSSLSNETKGFIFGLKVEDFPYDKISSIQYETGLIFGKLTIFTSGKIRLICG